MAFTGDMVTASEALAYGLVSKVVPDAELMVEARKLAMRIAENPPHAVRMTKRLIRPLCRARPQGSRSNDACGGFDNRSTSG